MYEKDISTKKRQKKVGTRISFTDSDKIRKRGFNKEANKREKETFRVNNPIMARKHRKIDIQQIFSSGKNVCLGEICVYFMDCEKDKSSPAFICGKKNIHLSTQRNLIKRRMREGIRGMNDRIFSNKDIMFVFRGKKVLSFDRISELMEGILIKANLIKKRNV